MGIFEAANHGTVFLDEIGDIELNFQLKLLRFLQEREIRPLGSARSKPVDVRVIAATNRDLQKMVEEEKFREDLWFRINVVRIVVPPLRERTGDVPLLAHYFLKKYNERYGQQTRLSESGLKVLQDYTWPGNVRQLQHMMERLTILAPNGRIDEQSVRARRFGRPSPGSTAGKPWPTRKWTRSGRCWRPPAATRAGPPGFWESSARRCIESWRGRTLPTGASPLRVRWPSAHNSWCFFAATGIQLSCQAFITVSYTVCTSGKGELRPCLIASMSR